MRCVTDVEVARKKQIHSAPCEHSHSHARAPYQVAFVLTFRQIEGMMGNYNLYDPGIASTKSLTHPRDLFFVDAPFFDRQRARGVDTQDRNLVVIVKRSQIVCDIASVFAQRLKETSSHIMERHVVVTRHNNLRVGQAIEKSTRFLELM